MSKSLKDLPRDNVEVTTSYFICGNATLFILNACDMSGPESNEMHITYIQVPPLTVKLRSIIKVFFLTSIISIKYWQIQEIYNKNTFKIEILAY